MQHFFYSRANGDALPPNHYFMHFPENAMGADQPSISLEIIINTLSQLFPILVSFEQTLIKAPVSYICVGEFPKLRVRDTGAWSDRVIGPMSASTRCPNMGTVGTVQRQKKGKCLLRQISWLFYKTAKTIFLKRGLSICQATNVYLQGLKRPH